jgi:hypothetical protein
MLLLGGMHAWAPVADAGCAVGPTIALKESSAAQGGKLTLRGSGFAPCNDVGINGARPAMAPMTGLRVYFVQGKRRLEIGRVDANGKFEISALISIPHDAAPGPATIEVQPWIFGSKPLAAPFRVTQQP